MDNIKIIKNRSDIGAGTRGSDLGIDAIEIAAINCGSDYFNRYTYCDVETENEVVYEKQKAPFAKRINKVLTVCTRLSEAVKLSLSENNFPLVLSGDHSSALGTISGIKTAFPEKRLGVVWIDAHADIHSPYTTPSGNVHGMPLAAALADDNLDRFTSAPANLSTFGQGVTGNPTATFTGRNAADNAFSASSIDNGTFQKANFDLVKPERVTSYEVGYRGALPVGDNKLGVDLSVYYNDYEDFISIKNIAVPYYGIVGDPGVQGQLALAALQNGDFAGVGFRTNSTADITSYGVGLGLNTKIFNGFITGLNYTLSRFDFDQSTDPDFEAGFNTPEHKVKFQFGHPNLFENFGFNFNARWQNEYYWQSSFLEGEVAARTILDAQVNYKLPKLKSVLKVGASNIGGQEYLSAPGGGVVGSQYFVSWTINN